MKKLFLLSLSVMALATAGFAQSKQAPRAQQSAAVQKEQTDNMEVQGIPINVYVKSQTDQMTKDLGLSPGQSSTLMEVNRNIAIKRSHAEKAATSRMQAQKSNDEISKFRMEQYQRVLTKDQYAKWAKANTDATVK
ncbi:MAG: hypothetical protein BGO69_11570 [Bacteroidetes bacterium 46-16]|nr:MAG: hypothetical protein BGO69_11570 [Bacteroidetes bacterium 46-16]